MDEALRALKGHFGYDEFRPGQREVVDALLSGRDALAVMPTGAGKSMCYQVPGVVLGGLTLVVSPLVSLMGDQVRALLDAGVRGAYLNSTLTPGQQATVLRRALGGAYQIMYVAPERLADPELFERLRALRKRLADEAGVPPYIVFSDATLRDMCAKLPSTEDEFLDVSGVGATKLARYGEAFLQELVAWREG